MNQIFDKKQDLSEQERDIFKDHLLRLQKIGDIVEQKIQKSLDKSEKKLRDYALMQEENTPNASKEFNLYQYRTSNIKNHCVVKKY